MIITITNNHHDETHQFPIIDSCKTAVVDKTLKLDKEAVRESAARRRRLHDKKSVVPSRESFCVLAFGLSRLGSSPSAVSPLWDFPAFSPVGFSRFGFSVSLSLFFYFSVVSLSSFLRLPT